MAIAGIYCAAGYSILRNGKPIYSAGNSEYDSQIYLPAGAPGTVSLETVKRYCETTIQELAEELRESAGRAVYADNTPEYFCRG